MTREKCRNKLIEMYLRLYLERFDTKPLFWCWEGRCQIQVIHEHEVKHFRLEDVVFGIIGKI